MNLYERAKLLVDGKEKYTAIAVSEWLHDATPTIQALGGLTASVPMVTSIDHFLVYPDRVVLVVRGNYIINDVVIPKDILEAENPEHAATVYHAKCKVTEIDIDLKGRRRAIEKLEALRSQYESIASQG